MLISTGLRALMFRPFIFCILPLWYAEFCGDTGPPNYGEPVEVLPFDTEMPNELPTLYRPPPEPALCPLWLLTPYAAWAPASLLLGIPELPWVEWPPWWELL